jgi:hypothetical protein
MLILLVVVIIGIILLYVVLSKYFKIEYFSKQYKFKDMIYENSLKMIKNNLFLMYQKIKN